MAPVCSWRATMASSIINGPTPHPMNTSSADWSSVAPAVAAPSTRQSTVASSRPMISKTAATVAESSVPGGASDGGRRRVGGTVCRRRGVLTDLQQLVRRDAALGHQVHQRREVVHVDRSDVGHQTLTLLGGQSHVGEDVHSRGGSGRRRLRRTIRLAGKGGASGKADEGDGGDGRSDQGVAHGGEQ